MIAINEHGISTVTLLLYTIAGLNGHIHSRSVFPESVFHPATLSKMYIMWQQKQKYQSTNSLSKKKIN